MWGEELFLDWSEENNEPDDEYCLENKIWITASRNEIPVEELSTDHINNIIKAFESGKIPDDWYGGKDNWLLILKRELENRLKKLDSFIDKS